MRVRKMGAWTSWTRTAPAQLTKVAAARLLENRNTSATTFTMAGTLMPQDGSKMCSSHRFTD